jgi:hypothetical protein
MSADLLADLAARLDQLADLPVGDHPQALDEVHRTLVSELDGLAGAGAADGRGSPRR